MGIDKTGRIVIVNSDCVTNFIKLTSASGVCMFVLVAVLDVEDANINNKALYI